MAKAISPEMIREALAEWIAAGTGRKPRTMPTAEYIIAMAVAMTGPAMPRTLFTAPGEYGAQGRREWCEKHGAPTVDILAIAKVKGDQYRATANRRHAAWRDEIPALAMLGWDMVKGRRDNDGRDDNAFYLYRVA
jgi:hypothetical protein